MISRLITTDHSILDSKANLFPLQYLFTSAAFLKARNPLTTLFFLLFIFWSPLSVGPLATTSDIRSSLFINGTMLQNGRVLYFVVEYFPSKGQPTSPFTANPKPIHGKYFLVTTVNGTMPAVEYKVRILAVLPNGTRKSLPQQMFYSSPEMPELVSIWTTENSLVFVYEQPYHDVYKTNNNFSYQLEYWPILPSFNGTSFYVRTNNTSIRLNGLSPDTVYRFRLFAFFFDVKSLDALELTVRTKKKRTALVPGKSTRPPSLPKKSDTGTLRNANETIMKRLGNGVNEPSLENGRTLSAEDRQHHHIARVTASVSIFRFQTTTTQMPIDSSKNTSQKIESLEKWNNSLISVNTISNGTNNQNNTEIEATKRKKGNNIETVLNCSSNESEASPVDLRENEDIIVEEDNQEEAMTTTAIEVSSTTESSVQFERSTIRMSLAVGNDGGALEELYLEWTVPERVVCDSFLVRYTVIEGESEVAGRRHETRTNSSFVRIPYLYGAKVELNVSCLFDSTLSSQWFAHRIVDLGKPEQVRNFRVKRVYTDEFYVASILLDFDVPFGHDPELYEIVVAWALGKRVVGGNKLIIRGEDGHQPNFVNISHLEPAKAYTFTVRNVSRELPSLSVAAGLRQITPPVITSTVYPGQISSNSINVNFGPSDADHPFDHYELVFSGSEKNVTKKLTKDDPKSFNFNKLIPGKTYSFTLYTVYKHIRSRPVISSITTYPLKVTSFNPLIGPGYATLFWTVQNEANNLCRFRLSYSSTSDGGIQKALTVELNGTVSQHRFSALDPNTYYTFTIIVIMGEGEVEAESESEAVTVGFGSFSQKAMSQFPLLQRYGTRELSLTFVNDRDIFPDLNGEINNFAVIVTEEMDTAGDSFELLSWYDMHEEELWHTYRASPSNYNPFSRGHSSTSTATFVIGEEECLRRKLNEPYCNGALRAHVDYFVKVRAYTVSMPQVAMETDWLSVNGRVDPIDKDEERAEKKLPCYMYLNGESSCSGSSSKNYNLSFILNFVVALSILVPFWPMFYLDLHRLLIFPTFIHLELNI